MTWKMSDNFSLKEIMELAKMKELRPREYEKTLKGMKDVLIDITKIGQDIVMEFQ